MSLIRDIGHGREPAAGRTGILGRLRSGSATPRPQPGGTPATLSGPRIPSGTPRPLSPGGTPRAPQGTPALSRPGRPDLSPRVPPPRPSGDISPVAAPRLLRDSHIPQSRQDPLTPPTPAPLTCGRRGRERARSLPGTGREETLEAQRQPGLRRRQARRLHQVSGRGRKSKPT